MTLTLDNICYDAIDMILCCLDVDDLVNIADTSRRLKEIAGRIFEQKYANTHVISIDELPDIAELSPVFTLRWSTQISEFRTKHDVSCSSALNWLKLLRNFGKSIKFMRIETERWHKRCEVPMFPWKYVNDYIAEYCTDSLEMLETNHNPLLVIRKPMKRLYSFSQLQIKSRSDRFSLAQMPHLQAFNRNLSILPEERKHMPHLKKLTVYIKQTEDVPIFCDFLQMNQQIIKLTVKIITEIDIDLVLLAISENLLQLKSLELHFSSVSSPHLTRFHRFVTVEKFSIHFQNKTRQAKVLRLLYFKNLKKLTISEFDYDESFSQFVARNEKLRKVRLTRDRYHSEETVLQKIANLESLDEISVTMRDFEFDLFKHPQKCPHGWKAIECERRPDDRNTFRNRIRKIKFERLK